MKRKPYQAFIEGWQRNALNWLRTLNETDPTDAFYRCSIEHELRRCIRRILILKALQSREL